MTRARSRLYMVNPPEVRIKLAGPSIHDYAAGSVEGAADQNGPSPLAVFRNALLDRSRSALEGSGISIDDVGHHQYQEVLYCSRGTDGCRVSLSYNGKFELRSMTIHPEGPLANDLRERIGILVGTKPGAVESETGEKEASPMRPFISAFDTHLRRLLANRDITVSSMKEHQWSLRYVAARDNRQATIDIYFDGKNRFTRCMPINPDGSTEGIRLMGEVIEIVTNEIVA